MEDIPGAGTGVRIENFDIYIVEVQEKLFKQFMGVPFKRFRYISAYNFCRPGKAKPPPGTT
ncbi:hypothetical protein ACVGV3_03915, partial [Enterobacter intestinihominis]